MRRREINKTQEIQVIPSTLAPHPLTDAQPIIPQQWLVAPGKRDLEGTCESPSVTLGLSATSVCPQRSFLITGCSGSKTVTVVLRGQYEGVFGLWFGPSSDSLCTTFLVNRGIKKCIAFSICTLISKQSSSYHFISSNLQCRITFTNKKCKFSFSSMKW